MDQNIKPLQAILIIGYFLLLLLAYMWAGDSALKNRTPQAVYTTHDGHVFIVGREKIYQFGSLSQKLAEIDFSRYQIDSDRQKLAFPDSSRILLRDKKDKALKYCNLNGYTCEAFSREPVEFGRIFHLVTSDDAETIFISDTSHHRILVFDKQGNKLFEQKDRLKYPNGMFYIDSMLYVANTNRHNISRFKFENQQLIFDKTIDIKKGVIKSAREFWPGELTYFNGQWWLLSFRGNMNDGGVYRLDKDWNILERISFGAEASPGSLANWSDTELLVVDSSNHRVYRIDQQGKQPGDFSSYGLNQEILQAQANDNLYTAVKYAVIAIFVVSVLTGLGIGFVREGEYKPDLDAQTFSQFTSSNDDALLWFEPDMDYIDKLQKIVIALIVAAVACISAMLALLYIESMMDVEIITMLFLLAVIFISISASVSYLMKNVRLTRIGIQGNELHLQDRHGTQANAQLDNAGKSRTHLVIGDVLVQYRNNQKLFFSENAGDRKLVRIAERIPDIPTGMWIRLLYKTKDPYFIVNAVIGLVAVVGLGVVSYLR